MTDGEFLRYETLLKSGLRKKELMHLEDDDAIIDPTPHGHEKHEIRVELKEQYGMPKNGRFAQRPQQRLTGARPTTWCFRPICCRLCRLDPRPVKEAGLFSCFAGALSQPFEPCCDNVVEQSDPASDLLATLRLRDFAESVLLNQLGQCRYIVR